MTKQNLTNHIAFILDKSLSMRGHAASLIKVTDANIAALARQSQDMKQETRVSIWTFGSSVENLIWDMDVLRLPSIADLYQVEGNTALIRATMESLDDLAMTPEKHGDHSFLVFVLTDGEENWSNVDASGRPDYRSPYVASALKAKLQSLPENWTVAGMVPNMTGKHNAKQFGFPSDNIAIWDTSSDVGAKEAGEVMLAATTNYMATRATRAPGSRGTRNLFQMNTAAATSSAVKQLQVKPLERGKFILIPPPSQDKTVLKDMIEDNGLKFRIGLNYYQLMKPEKIQADKKIALVRKQRKGVSEADVFVGYEIRDFLGLPDHEVRVGPQSSPDYDIFVQSNSNNRHMMKNQHLLILEPAYK